MVAGQAAQDAIAQNLANASTTGFKEDIPRFQSFEDTLIQRLSAQNGARVGGLGHGAQVRDLTTNFADGALQKTGNPLDVALSGDAFLAVQTPAGVRLSRDGALSRSASGLLVQANGGALVLGANNRPISLPASAKNIVISPQGEILADKQSVGKLQMVGVSRATSPVKIGDSLFMQAKFAPASASATVHQGFLEASNVSVVKEMVQMIAVMRAYETDQKMLQAEDEATGKAVNEVTKL